MPSSALPGCTPGTPPAGMEREEDDREDWDSVVLLSVWTSGLGRPSFETFETTPPPLGPGA